MTRTLDLGDNHSAEFVQYKDETSGLIAIHLTPAGEKCVGGFIPFTGGTWDKEFDGKIASWELISMEPLTLTPSLLCTVCGDHGFITGGRWIRA